MLTLTIAWRNLWRHRGKSLVIGSILFLGAFLMTLGNGVVGGMEAGLQRNVRESFTGDVVIASAANQSDNFILEMMGRAVEPTGEYLRLREILREHPLVETWLPVGKNMVMTINEDGGNPGWAFVLGVDFAAWDAMFPGSFELLTGRRPKPGEAGVLMPRGGAENLYEHTGTWYAPVGVQPDSAMLSEAARGAGKNLRVRDSIVFLGFNQSNSTTDMRLPILGEGRYRALNTIWGNFLLMDIRSYRQCLGYFDAEDQSRQLDGKRQQLLEADALDLDALFGEEEALKSWDDASAPEAGISGESTMVEDPEAGIYNLVLVRLREGVSPKQGAEILNEVMKDSGLNLRAATWQTALGTVGSMSLIIKSALFLFVLLLFLVAIIIIVNTLSMAALERTAEIGMMRAIGARRSFVSAMFLGETAVLSVVFGGLGIALGALVVLIVPYFEITTKNDLLQLFFGGDAFHPLLLPSDFLLAGAQLLMVTVLAVIYPLHIARAITPLDAISRE